ncbi:MAG: methyltransferase domain-containing protein [Endozoicomonas sp. (ex Botrylloides leachii)]|nr:methyltransferase domain-containing protein [Endozoicomonas sp. (ex Botrylloides leachii)]
MNNIWNPKHYSKNAPVQQELAFEILSNINLNNCNILDIGCGDGSITDSMRKKNNHVTGVDSNKEMITFARENYPKCSFIMKDITSFSSGSPVGLITSFNCLHWVKNIHSALNNIFHSLSSSGRFLGIIYPRCDHLWLASENLIEHEKYSKYFTEFENPYQFHTKQSFTGLLKRSGFKKIKVVQKDHIKFFDSDKIFTDYISGWMPHVKISPPQFLKDWLIEYKKISSQENSCTTYMKYT